MKDEFNPLRIKEKCHIIKCKRTYDFKNADDRLDVLFYGNIVQ